MNKYHKQILEKIQKASPIQKRSHHTESYHGTTHKYYDLRTYVKRGILKEWKSENPDLSYEEWLNLMDSLNLGESYEEKTSGASLLGLYPKYRIELDPRKLDEWLTNLEGWAEIDTLCQSTFGADEMLQNWEQWSSLLKKFAGSQEVAKRRASLVLLTKPVREIEDERLKSIAFENIKRLMHEKDILITKAISWLLRDMIKVYRDEVVKFLDDNEDKLPKIALRETKKKLLTGKK